MTKNDKDELAWAEMQRRVAALLREKDYTTAILEVNAFLSQTANPELLCLALGLRSVLKEELGDLQGAREDLLQTLSLTQPRSESRYGTEFSLGYVCEKQRAVDEALGWYRAALTTCSEGEVVSGAAALKGDENGR